VILVVLPLKIGHTKAFGNVTSHCHIKANRNSDVKLDECHECFKPLALGEFPPDVKVSLKKCIALENVRAQMKLHVTCVFEVSKVHVCPALGVQTLQNYGIYAGHRGRLFNALQTGNGG